MTGANEPQRVSPGRRLPAGNFNRRTNIAAQLVLSLGLANEKRETGNEKRLLTFPAVYTALV
jgi:hypothetical protein